MRESIADNAAGLWDVEDYASRALFERFHQELSAGKTVAAALRDAQLSLARSPDPRVNRVHHWAAFEPLGVPWVRAVGGS